MSLSERLRRLAREEKYLRLFRYGVVGVLTTAVSYGVYWILYDRLAVEVNASNIISILCAVTFAYAANKVIVFRSRCPDRAALWREIVSFYAARGVAMAVEAGGVFVLHDLAGLTPMLSKVAVGVAVLILNYILSRLFVFRDKM